jgi:hypothetical protein
MRDICLSWGIGNPELFASATLLRPWRAKQRTNGDPQANVRKESEKTDLEMQREMKERLKSFLVNVELLPKELIFVGRGMRILQANNQALGKIKSGLREGNHDHEPHIRLTHKPRQYPRPSRSIRLPFHVIPNTNTLILNSYHIILSVPIHTIYHRRCIPFYSFTSVSQKV